jgi:hypothetical protein
MEKQGYIVEMTRVGNQVKATACDPQTGTEATVMAPANITKKDLMDLAVRKLQYVLAKPK